MPFRTPQARSYSLRSISSLPVSVVALTTATQPHLLVDSRRLVVALGLPADGWWAIRGWRIPFVHPLFSRLPAPFSRAAFVGLPRVVVAGVRALSLGAVFAPRGAG